MRSALTRAFAPVPAPPKLAGAAAVRFTQESALLSMAAELHGRSRLACPVEILSDDADQIIPGRDHAEWLVSFLPRARHYCVPGGHMLHHNRPDLVRGAVRNVAPLAA